MSLINFIKNKIKFRNKNAFGMSYKDFCKIKKSSSDEVFQDKALERFVKKEELVEEHQKDVLFDYNFGRVEITKELKDAVKAHPEKYSNCPVRVQMCKFYTDEEYEQKVNAALNTPLPGSESITRKRKR